MIYITYVSSVLLPILSESEHLWPILVLGFWPDLRPLPFCIEFACPVLQVLASTHRLSCNRTQSHASTAMKSNFVFIEVNNMEIYCCADFFAKKAH